MREREECVRGIVSNSSVDVRQLSQSSLCPLTCMQSLLELCIPVKGFCSVYVSSRPPPPARPLCMSVNGHHHPQDLITTKTATRTASTTLD
jgi:hypothetical protein